jgi:hypothetical protein
MEFALDVCNRFLVPNYSSITKEFNLEQIILSKHYKNKTISRVEIILIYRVLLASAEENQ